MQPNIVKLFLCSTKLTLNGVARKNGVNVILGKSFQPLAENGTAYVEYGRN